MPLPDSPTPKRRSVSATRAGKSPLHTDTNASSMMVPLSISTPTPTITNPRSPSFSSSSSSLAAVGPLSPRNNTHSRRNRFQICVWITLVLAFLHLISRPSFGTPPEDYQVKTKADDSTTTAIHIPHGRPPSSTTTGTTGSTSSGKEPPPPPSSTPMPAQQLQQQQKGEKTTKTMPSPSSSRTPKRSKAPRRTPSPTTTTTTTTTAPVSSVPLSTEKNEPNETMTSSPSLGPTNTSTLTKPTKGTDKDEDDDDKDDQENGHIDSKSLPPPPTSSPTQDTPPPPLSSSSSYPLPSSSPPPPPPPPPSSSSSYSVHAPKTADDVSDISRAYVRQHCDMAHLNPPDANSWYPTGPDDSWQQRAPYFIVAGVWNAGINELAETLWKQHPQIIKAKISGFFLPKQFYRYYKKAVSTTGAGGATTKNATTTTTTTTTDISNVKVFAARNKMYALVYSPSSLRDDTTAFTAVAAATTTTTAADEDNHDGDNNNNNNNNNRRVAMDVSPGLIFYARTTAHAILCVAPWTKIVVVLRNPIDRVYRQWLYSRSQLGLKKLSLEDWMAQEMKLLHDVGLIDASTSRGNGGKMTGANSEDSEETVVVSEKDAWNKYQSVRNIAGAIGRSLYVLQLEEWINTFKEAGKVPSEEMIILASEHVEAQPQKEYAKLTRFLGLAPFNVTSSTTTAATSSSSAGPMKEETRKMLQAFFRPYNRRLIKLLQENGFEGDWGSLWK